MIVPTIIALILITIVNGLYHRFKSIQYPKPVTTKVAAKNISFFGKDIQNQIISHIKKAKELIVIDVFMFNTHNVDNEKAPEIYKNINLSCEKFVVVDPCNTLYGTIEYPTLKELQKRNVTVSMINLDKFPDNNLIFSPVWRTFLQPFGTRGISWTKNPVVNKKTTVRALLKALNFKANHRKVIVCDNTTIVTSMNLDNKSKNYNNSGLIIKSKNVANIAISQAQHLLDVSKKNIKISRLKTDETVKKNEKCKEEVTMLTGKYIKEFILKDINQAKTSITIAMLFVADTDIISALKQAHKRGVKIVMFLDNNRVSFNSRKKGFPNRTLAHEFAQFSKVFFSIKKGAELHDKLIIIDDKKPIAYCGSANLTRRSLLGTNPETMVRVQFNKKHKVIIDMKKYLRSLKIKEFEPKKEKEMKAKVLLTKIMEKTGAATF